MFKGIEDMSSWLCFIVKVEVLIMEGYTKKKEQTLNIYECANFNIETETFLF